MRVLGMVPSPDPAGPANEQCDRAAVLRWASNQGYFLTVSCIHVNQRYCMVNTGAGIGV